MPIARIAQHHLAVFPPPPLMVTYKAEPVGMERMIDQDCMFLGTRLVLKTVALLLRRTKVAGQDHDDEAGL
jgi:hypothetical protein